MEQKRKWKISDFWELLKNGISHIDAAFITHEDLDHSLGIKQLEDIFDVRDCIMLA